ncbi:MAG: glycosyltransferase [Anaerolineales bacterium]|nr:glycosyltransferase [Anaerolineales bacterium]
MNIHENDTEKPINKFQYYEEHKIRNLLLSEVESLYFFWKIRFILNKIKNYIFDVEKCKFKINSIIWNVLRRKKFDIKPYPDTFKDAYKNKLLKYIFLLKRKHNRENDLTSIGKIIERNAEKKIIVYPQTVYWEPLQRPQQLLKELGKKGYLCFFCEPEKSKLEVQEVSENVYTISGERYLVYPLQNKHVIVLCTWMLNLPFINLLENKTIWYDLIDRLELFSLYDVNMLELHEQVVEGADLVTYSGLNLKSLVSSREDAVYLPNGVFYEDFNFQYSDRQDISTKVNFIFNEIKKPIIGFYGSVAEWLDYELIRKLAEFRVEWSFVFIGKIWTDIDLIKDIPNIHLLGLIPYQELPYYANNFDVTIIPFLINQITDSVSAIKLFEYAALGKPVVATPFFEITQYQDQPFIRLASNAEEFSKMIDGLLLMPSEKIEESAKLFARKNQWKDRITLIESRLNE